MPRYSYRCLECDKEFDVLHPIGEKHVMCSELLECDKKGEIQKVYSIPRIYKNERGIKKVGDEVRKFIKDSSEDLRQQKKELKQKVFKEEK